MIKCRRKATEKVANKTKEKMCSRNVPDFLELNEAIAENPKKKYSRSLFLLLSISARLGDWGYYAKIASKEEIVQAGSIDFLKMALLFGEGYDFLYCTPCFL